MMQHKSFKKIQIPESSIFIFCTLSKLLQDISLSNVILAKHQQFSNGR